MKSGVQCESVVRFPRLFEKYPFPILINSAFLRLADVFRAGFVSYIILWILRQIYNIAHLDMVSSNFTLKVSQTGYHIGLMAKKLFSGFLPGKT